MSDPTDLAAYEKALAKHTIGQPQPLTAPIEVPDYDPSWPNSYEREAARIRSILGERVVRIEHVGSTSVRGLAAKPIIDIALEVPDSTDEAAYVPDMEAAGYVLRIREDDWFQHRLFKVPDMNINLRYVLRRLRRGGSNARLPRLAAYQCRRSELYARTKRELATRDWKYMQQYADAKTAVVREIMARASPAAP